ncbi:uncharacterized protein GGS25DRAFT_507521 [Hypoxylon fragiforme]|uniref:uncharacterized protein n=1 Tax=Hypoxylon fragiforme TaxID=63214 RepID=UPI0020C65FA2|nr:uncharacterized protein GGS25DRAFT_507521 [Hypoxylon fragiforme]KAI2604261.1 hypothetical protein GGS25DRAFT_507521 [Hypoxylon fragiforme]
MTSLLPMLMLMLVLVLVGAVGGGGESCLGSRKWGRSSRPTTHRYMPLSYYAGGGYYFIYNRLVFPEDYCQRNRGKLASECKSLL